MSKQKKHVQAKAIAQPEISNSNEEIKVEEITKELPKFNFVLRVVNPFKGYKKANEIRDALAIQAVIDGGDLRNCVKVSITSEE